MTRRLAQLSLAALLPAVACAAPGASTQDRASPNEVAPASGETRPAPAATAQPISGAPTPTASRPAPALDSARHGVRAPMTARIQGPANPRPGDVITVELTVHRPRPNAQPMRLEAKIPRGARLVSGQPLETIRNQTDVLVRRTFRFAIAQIPADDLQVVVASRGRSHGVRATARYGFGRPAPKLPQPSRAKQPTVIGGRNLGRPIVIPPPTTGPPPPRRRVP